MNTRILFYFFIGIYLFLGSCSSDSTKGQDNSKKIQDLNYFPKFSSLQLQEIQQKRKISNEFYRKYLQSSNFNGSFLVAKHGKIIYERYVGNASFSPVEKNTVSTPLHVASISKVATALGALRLVDAGKVILDEDIRTYLPEILYQGITVRMLLNHRSGIPYYGYFTANTWDISTPLTNKDILTLLNKHKFPLNFQPGKKFSYCNTNFALLALIIERATKQEFPAAMHTLIFEPLGMKNSFFVNSKASWENATPSHLSNKKRFDFEYTDAVCGDKNLFTTPRDLYKMDQATYSDLFLSPEMRAEMFRGYSYENPGKANYGLGIRMKEVTGKDTYFFHTGWWHGSTSCYASLRNDSACIVAISNVYSKNVYSINRLALQFGNYPFQFAEEK